MEKNIQEKPSFWKSSTGLIIKIAGIISALTVIVSFAIKFYDYVKETNTRKNEAQIRQVIKDYYAKDDANDYSGLASLFDISVDDYFGKPNFTQAQIVEDRRIYCLRWPFHKNMADYSSIKVNQLDNGNYFVTYHHLYKTKRHQADDWRNFNLQIDMEFNWQFKIKAISEKKL